jgi:hypothetical protein
LIQQIDSLASIPSNAARLDESIVIIDFKVFVELMKVEREQLTFSARGRLNVKGRKGGDAPKKDTPSLDSRKLTVGFGPPTAQKA